MKTKRSSKGIIGTYAALCIGALFATNFAHAQVKVVDLNASAAKQVKRSGGNANLADLFNQLQILQEEVSLLRGALEEQQHELTTLKKQRKDDYTNLDQRIVDLASQPRKVVAATAAGASASAPVIAEDEKQAYFAAYQLIKNRNLSAAKVKFVDFLQSYPTGSYAPNAHYWLGELYLLDRELDLAEQSFSAVSTGYPGHQKTPDAQFKLAKVYDLQGKQDQAKTLLNTLIGTQDASHPAVRLAKEYMQNQMSAN